jgi:Na+/H+ antiporter NhaD/arsenite permease-like protein
VAGQRLPWVLVDRPAAALCGAVAMVAFDVLTVEEAYAAVNLDTLLLLLGVMVIAAYLMQAKFFRHTAWWVLTRARSARRLLWSLVFVSGGLSALLVNDTICLMFTPLVLAVVTEAELPPLPYLLGLAAATNVGGVITFTGNPQNMIVGMAARGNPGYLEYLALALPAGLLALVSLGALLTWLFRHELPAGPLRRRETARPYLDRQLAGKAVGALLLFVVLAIVGTPLAGASLTAAALLIMVARIPPKEVLERVDWVLLLFFSGLFVVVRGLEKSGALEAVLEPLRPLVERGGVVGLLGFAALTAVGSNLVSNVPFVLVASKWVGTMPEPRWGWVFLAFASTLAGNLTLFGSVANLIVFQTAGPRAPIGFLKFLRYGIPITLTTMGVALLTLLLERFLGV